MSRLGNYKYELRPIISPSDRILVRLWLSYPRFSYIPNEIKRDEWFQYDIVNNTLGFASFKLTVLIYRLIYKPVFKFIENIIK